MLNLEALPWSTVRGPTTMCIHMVSGAITMCTHTMCTHTMCTRFLFTHNVHTVYRAGAQGVSTSCTCPKGSLIHLARPRTVHGRLGTQLMHGRSTHILGRKRVQ